MSRTQLCQFLINQRKSQLSIQTNHAAKRSHRATIFVDWILSTFSDLNKGTGVLDIAGGRGDVSFLLACRNIKSTVIDPKTQPNIKRFKRYALYKEISRDDRLGEVAELISFKQIEWCVDRDDLWVKESSLLVGMHPDEATEDIVRVAVAYGLPFAVVPCCVFNKNRMRMNSGRLVSSYLDLIDYLIEIAGRCKEGRYIEVKQCILPFEGKPICIYSLGRSPYVD